MKFRSAESILDGSYLETRAKLLEVAAILDRIDRALDVTSGTEMSEAAVTRHDQLVRAIRLLLSDSPRRAEEIQQLFSRTYDPNWRSEFGLLPEHAAPATQTLDSPTQNSPAQVPQAQHTHTQRD